MTTETVNESAVVESAPVEMSQPVETAQAEKMIPQSMVNEIVGSARQKAYSKGSDEAKRELDDYFAQKKAEMEAEMKAQFAQKATKASPKATESGSPDIESLIKETIANQSRESQEAALRSQQENYVRTQFQQLAEKIQASKDKYEDFDQVTSEIDLIQEAPELLVYANAVENSADVIYHLAKHPGKIGSLKQLSPKAAAIELRNLSASLKTNETATSTQRPSSPLSQIKPSAVGDGTGKPSLKELKAHYSRRAR